MCFKASVADAVAINAGTYFIIIMLWNKSTLEGMNYSTAVSYISISMEKKNTQKNSSVVF